ncbi:hypothetical protein [Georgenia sp. SUBG003]|uniref:hypothetical protein n=1 Tax=Georgenia sp. SUBG003 TaxID=1497974 RepID=UPI0004D922F8|nr:hypothetical protein DA06_06860 [Georgenia sp. SUBG003]
MKREGVEYEVVDLEANAAARELLLALEFTGERLSETPSGQRPVGVGPVLTADTTDPGLIMHTDR